MKEDQIFSRRGRHGPKGSKKKVTQMKNNYYVVEK